MDFDTIRFLEDYNIEYNSNHHHVTKGRVGIEICPFCFSDGYKFALHISKGSVNCWICGGHSMVSAIAKLLNIGEKQAAIISRKYSSGNIPQKAERRSDDALKPCLWPKGCEDNLTFNVVRYLDSRNFDHIKIRSDYGIKFCGYMGGQMKFRIIIPVLKNKIMVSYVGRDITGKAASKYMSCPKDKESYHHRHCLYNHDNAYGDKIVVVEGPTDVWRLGKGSVATFGVNWTMPQAALLKKYKRVFILYDMAEDAQRSALRLCEILAVNNVDVEIIELKLDKGKDPADMTQDDADHLMRELGMRR